MIILRDKEGGNMTPHRMHRLAGYGHTLLGWLLEAWMFVYFFVIILPRFGWMRWRTRQAPPFDPACWIDTHKDGKF